MIVLCVTVTGRVTVIVQVCHSHWEGHDDSAGVSQSLGGSR